jgi:hypothetical protein
MNNENCNHQEETQREIIFNKGMTVWTVDEAKSLECFHKEEFCFVDCAFADEETAVNYLKERFGGLVYNPANIPTKVYPNDV